MPAMTGSGLAHPRLRYVPGLDGLRAVAVLAVMAYHSGLGWMPGGFLGVDLFFTLSGYLITTLLIREWEATATIDLIAFWSRRARRLLPAILLVLIAVAIYAVAVADPGALGRLRFDSLATLGYVANWRFIYSHQSYFESFAVPSPLRHMWSLGVEEQWYLLWPWVMALAMRRSRGRTLPVVGAIAFAAVASAVAMAAQHTPFEDPSRAYFGTDTRAHTLLVGAALAFVLRPGGWTEGSTLRRVARWWRVTAHTGGSVAAAAILVAFVAVHDSDGWLYNGGFFLFALGAALVIAAAIAPGPNLVKVVLDRRPLRVVGLISYGLYLWHWPVNVVLVPDRVGVSGLALAGLRTATTFALATASFVLVERPVRLGRVRIARPAWVGAGAIAATAALAVAATVSPSTVNDPTDALALGAARFRDPALVPPAPRSGPGASASTTTPSTATPLSALPTAEVASASARAPAPPAPPRLVNALLVGDSVAFTLGIGFLPNEKFHLNLQALLGCASIDGDSLTGATTYDHEDCGRRYDLWRQGFDRPIDIALLMVGAWEVFDRVVDGRRIPFGSTEHQGMLRIALQRDVNTLVAAGAPRVALLTVPCHRERDDALGGSGSVRNDADRVAVVNSAIAATMAANPDTVTTIDIASFVCPDGRFRESLDGVELRPDGVHYSLESAPLVWRWLMPVVTKLATRPRL